MSKDIENIFKQKFENFEAAPSPDLFDKIQNNRSKKKRVMWIWSPAAVIVTTGIIGFLLSDFNANKSYHQEIAQLEIELSEDTDLKTPAEQKDKLTKDRLITRKETLLENTYNAQGISNSIQKDCLPQQDKNLSKQESSENQLTATPQKNQIADSSLAQLFREITDKTSNNNNLGGGTLYVRNQEQQLENTPIIRRNSATISPPNSIEKTQNVLEIEKSETHSTIRESAVSEEISEEENIFEGQEGKESKEDKNQRLPLHKLVDKSRWSISASAGLGIGGRSLSGNTALAENRNNTEFQQLSNVVDLRLVYDINSKWNIQFGINRAERNENFYYEEADQTIKNFREEERTETVIHPILGTYTRTYTVTVEEEQVQEGETYNTNNVYTNVTIPISLERELFDNKYVAIMARTGFLVGLSSKASGENLDQEKRITTLSGKTYRSKGIHFALLGIGASLKASSRVSLIAYPEYRFGLNSAYNGDLINQRESAFYTNLGIRIRL